MEKTHFYTIVWWMEKDLNIWMCINMNIYNLTDNSAAILLE